MNCEVRISSKKVKYVKNVFSIKKDLDKTYDVLLRSLINKSALLLIPHPC